MAITLDDILKTIRTRESGGNYAADAPKSSASGAYQFVDGTWQMLTRKFGIEGAPGSAGQASPEMQDLVAGMYVADILERHGGDVRAIPAEWYVGRYDPDNLDYVPAPEAGNSLSVREYVNHWLDDLQESSGSSLGGGIEMGGMGGGGMGGMGGGDAAKLQTFLDAAVSQQGDPYVWGGKHDGMVDNPNGFDCSGLVSWAADRAGVELTNGSWLQFTELENRGGAMGVEDALGTPGALVFRFSSDPRAGGRPRQAHVAISLGDGRVVEAVNAGVVVREANPERWTHAAAIPELGTELADESATATGSLTPMPGTDSDGDGLLDNHEVLIGTDPFAEDTDLDGFVDSVELMDHRTDPLDFADNAMVRATGDVPEYRPPLSFDLPHGQAGSPLDQPFHGGLQPGMRVDIDQSTLAQLAGAASGGGGGVATEPPPPAPGGDGGAAPSPGGESEMGSSPPDDLGDTEDADADDDTDEGGAAEAAMNPSLDDRVDAILEGYAPGSLADELADGTLDQDMQQLLDELADAGTGEVSEDTLALVESIFGEDWNDNL